MLELVINDQVPQCVVKREENNYKSTNFKSLSQLQYISTSERHSREQGKSVCHSDSSGFHFPILAGLQIYFQIPKSKQPGSMNL